MGKSTRSRAKQVSNFILVAVGFGLIYWFAECVVQVFLFYEGNAVVDVLTRGSFSDRLLTRLSTPTPDELWVRLLMMIAFVLFGGFVQHTVRLRMRAETNLERLNRELERRVDERTAQLATANRELEAFNYTVSHDLRSPLRIILGLSRELLEVPPEPLAPPVRDRVTDIHQSSEKMGRLIDDLLALSRSGRRELQVSPLDIGEMARLVFRGLMTTQRERAVSLDVRDMPPAAGDLSMLREAMLNLLSNALKFTGPRPEARIEVGGFADKAKHEHVYYVKDNGVGFDPKYTDRLFQVFRRLHSDEDFEGTGVGLAIVQRIMERHGGRVWAEGAVGQGATFYFALPAPRG